MTKINSLSGKIAEILLLLSILLSFLTVNRMKDVIHLTIFVIAEVLALGLIIWLGHYVLNLPFEKQVSISSIVDKANYRIISLSGQIVMSGSSVSENVVIDLSNLSSGVYIVEVTDGNEQRVQHKKVVLQ